MKFTVRGELVIEAVEEGALVFDSSSGATSLINQCAMEVLHKVRDVGVLDESELRASFGTKFSDTSELSGILASLEKNRLIIRC